MYIYSIINIKRKVYMSIFRNQPDIFAVQGKELTDAHKQGADAFNAAAGRALDFVLDHPARVLGEDAAAPSDSFIEVTYEAAFGGLRRAIGDEKLRRRFAASFYAHLTDSDGSPELELAREAFHNSFPDEAGEPGGQAEEFLRYEHFSNYELERTNTDPRVFAASIRQLIRQAESLDGVIKATNKEQSRLWVAHSYRGRNRRVVLKQHKGKYWRESIVIGSDASGSYFMERTTQRTERGAGTASTVVIQEKGKGDGRVLRGRIETGYHKRQLDKRGMLFQVDNIMETVSTELEKRQRQAKILTDS